MTFECVECFSEVQKVDEQGRCESCGESGLGAGVGRVSGFDGRGGDAGSEGRGRGERVGSLVAGVPHAPTGGVDGDGSLVSLRTGRGLTQQQLADELGVSVRTISRWETGKATPSKMALKILRSEGL